MITVDITLIYSDGKGNMTIYTIDTSATFVYTAYAIAKEPHCGSTSVAFTMLFFRQLFFLLMRL